LRWGAWETRQNIPLDGEAGDAGLLGQDVAADVLDEGLGGRVVGELLRVVLVVDVVADADKLAAVVGARQEDHGNTEQLVDGDALSIRGLGLKDELVDADGDGADEQRVELLVVVVGLSGTHIGQLPLKIFFCGGVVLAFFFSFLFQRELCRLRLLGRELGRTGREGGTAHTLL